MSRKFEIDAEIALRTIRSECGVDSNGFGGDRTALARRSGQLFLVLVLARASAGRVSLDALELAAVDRMVTPAELMREIIRPLVARGFCRYSRGEVVATSALVRHRNPIEALMAGESLESSDAVRSVAIEKVRVGDYVLGVGRIASAFRRDRYENRVTVLENDGAGDYYRETAIVSNVVTVAR